VTPTDIRRGGWRFWALIGLSIGGVIPILGMPLIVGALEDHWGYSAAYAGYITSVDLAGLFVGAVATSVWANKIDWKRVVGAAIVLCCVMNVLCVWFHALAALCILRFCAGLASGVAYSSSLTLLSRVPDTARGFSIVIFAQVIANALVLAVFPAIDTSWGPGGLFVTIAAVMAATLIIVPSLPRRDPWRAPDVPLSTPTARPRTMSAAVMAALCLTAVALVYVAIGCYWAYAERMGIHFGLGAGLVHHLLTASVLVSSVGCIAAYRLSRSVGQSRPLLAALIVLSVTLLIHSGSPKPVMYVLALGVVQLCWNFVDIFQLGTLAIVDPSGRSAALIPAAQGIALAAGPAAGATALTMGQGYWAVLIVAGGAATLATVCYSIVYAFYLRTAEPKHGTARLPFPLVNA
jgi:predicted MFS family arabinose efflux permease